MATPKLRQPLKLWLQVTQTCNLRCRHCYGDCGPVPPDGQLSRGELLGFFDYLVENDVMGVLIEGGEPLTRPDLTEILQGCCRRLLTYVRTNATLVTPEVAAEFKALGVGGVLVDLFAATPETHEYLSGVEGSFERTLSGIKALVAAGLKVIPLCILTRQNIGELQQFLQLSKDLGANRAGVLRLYPLGRARRNWDDLSLSLEEMVAALDGLEPPDGLHLMQSWHPKDPNCCWQNAGVDAFGNSVGCSYLRDFVNYGNIRDVPLLQTWDHPLYRELRSGNIEESCSDCEGSQGTRGGCRSTAYAFSGTWRAPDPYCTTLNKGVDLRVLPQWLRRSDPEPQNAIAR